MEQTTQNESSPSQEEIEVTTRKLQVCIYRYVEKLNECLAALRERTFTENRRNELKLHKTNIVDTMLELHKFNSKFNLEKAITKEIQQHKVSRGEPKELVAPIMNAYNDRRIEAQINQLTYKSEEKPTKEPAKISTGVFNTIATTLRDLFTSTGDNTPS
jgi:predicted translin family RNA/ssDNA-binding protein